MKKIVVMALMVTLLFTGIGTMASAADTCQHNWRPDGNVWLPTGQGYNHPYTVSPGVTAGCGVTVKKNYDSYKCGICDAILYKPTGKDTREYHEIPSHNTF